MLKNIELTQGDVHIWMINLDPDDHQVASYGKILSPQESDRAVRFYFKRHHRRYTVSHGAMRKILGTYLDAAPQSLVYETSDHGKPSIAGDYKNANLQFNLTHSHEIALLAVVRGVEIGVDVEYMQQMGDIDGIAGRFFSAAEQAEYFALPNELKPQGFFHCWTRKEAFIKAVGDGLSYPLDRFDVSLIPGETATLLQVAGDPVEARQWTFDSFHPTPDYTAAVALRARDIRFKHFWF